MSIDQPNEYEQAIEDYADGVRREKDAFDALRAAQREVEAARDAKQELWRHVNAYINEAKIKPGMYRLRRGPSLYAEGVLIEPHHDYPDVFPMFR